MKNGIRYHVPVNNIWYKWMIVETVNIAQKVVAAGKEGS
jgi:hypothetical protein